ncbi:hypothetical protein [Azospirillum sp.]|uniref:hypothetical protein n=1 Tax=Azospirillum sp. TaxID=34012 RepID=UPI002D25F7A9|nr:hypothetical protein [Azospirillum sp.]HYD64598.1 hypothetical protein [Azospirillum sp.]
MVSVFIAESNAPGDFYEGRLDGFAANEVLKVRRLRTAYRAVLDIEHLERAIEDAADFGADILHLSCHGDHEGIQLSDTTCVDWPELAALLRPFASADRMIVLSACKGGHVDFTKALLKSGSNVRAVFGALGDPSFSASCIAWSILYNELADEGLEPAAFQSAVDKINHVVRGGFVYRTYDPQWDSYEFYPWDALE